MDIKASVLIYDITSFIWTWELTDHDNGNPSYFILINTKAIWLTKRACELQANR